MSLLLLIQKKDLVCDNTVVGAMLTSTTKMEQLVPDVLMSVIAHGNVEINMTQVNVTQVGNAIRPKVNAFWLQREKVMVATLLVPNIASQLHHQLTNIDAILQVISATNVKKEIKDAVIENQHALNALTQIQLEFIDAIELTKLTHNAKNAQVLIRLTAHPALKLATAVQHLNNFILVTIRLSLASQLTILVALSKHVTQLVATSHQRIF